jgi:peptide/nickel transport system permease protein
VGIYVVKRVVWTGALFLTLATVTFVLFFVVPHTNPGAGRRRGPLRSGSPLDVHGSIVQEYGQFLSRIAHGALGTSSSNGHSVMTILTTAAPATFGLVLGGAVLWMLIAVPLGLLTALRPRSRTARGSRAFAAVGLSLHPLVLGLALSWLFGVRLGWFPPGGYCDALGPEPDCGGPIPWSYHMVLPWAAFALIFGAFYVRLIHVNARAGLQKNHVLTARAKGVSDWGVLRSHVFSTSAGPILTALVLDIGGLAMAAAIFVETAFGIPGLGRTAAQSVQRRDLPVIIGILLFVALTVAIASLIADLAYAFVDRRVRLRPASS